MPNPICPRCGSKNTMKIVYKLPNEGSLKDRTDAEKTGLSSSQNTLNPPRFVCRDCHRKFGALQPLPLEEFFFLDGGFFEGYESISIHAISNGAICEVQHSFQSKRNPEDYSLSPAELNQFRDVLYNKLFLADWKKNYFEYPVCDGEEYELNVKLQGKPWRKRSGGTGNLPIYWDKLLKFIKPYLHKS